MRFGVTSTLRIRMLGAFEARYGDEPIADLRSTRVQELLAYLLLHSGVAHPRRQLAFLFWPDSSEAQAHTNLRKVIHSLRLALPDSEEYLRIDGRSAEANHTAGEPARLRRGHSICSAAA